MDAEAPLLRGSFAQGADGKEVWVYFKYERLPWFCYHCGRMGHVAKDCPRIDDADLLNPSLFQYEEELRASPLRRPAPRFGAQVPNNNVKRKLVFKPVGSNKVTRNLDEQLPDGGLQSTVPGSRLGVSSRGDKALATQAPDLQQALTSANRPISV
ncbi:hypothetical protein Tsubulata_048883 [Turnera subulata]|uniref:CCHC-type domain-containing protein n=1 Tax=Turnera subulata TaxID=218843 RepID=A0A9Q0G3U2_9ROSI|nr:hypothetical protein Tsubulata_048883 [Turnera subulata]